jgi:hypothetical protein
MRRRKSGILLMGLAALACSARYEVGQMDPSAEGGASNGGGTASAGTLAGGNASTAGSASALGVFGPQCIKTGSPAELTGEFAAPDVVWSRIEKMIWGDAHLPPEALPAQTSYGWAGDVVDQAFEQALAEMNSVPGGSFFVVQWLKLGDAEEPLKGDYDSQLARSTNVMLEVLLQSSWAPGHAGVFSEAAWLLRHQSIPARGAAILEAVFSRVVPAPPPSVDRNVIDVGLQDRAAIEATMSSPACASCHSLMNPLGYALGHFDRAGNYRELDHDLPIDTTGTFMADGQDVIAFDGIADFGAKAADTCHANLSIADGFLRVALTELGYDETTREAAIEANRERVQQAFVAGGRSYPALVKAFAQSALVLRP